MRPLLIAEAILLFVSPSHAHVYPPGTFSIDGIPVVCGSVVTVVNNNIHDFAQSDLKGHIFVNLIVLSQMPTVLKLWGYAHECGHYQMGPNETAADCWAIRTGREQGWFKNVDFSELEAMFANNSGDLYHPPGPVRVANMKKCFGSSEAKHSHSDGVDVTEPEGSFC